MTYQNDVIQSRHARLFELLRQTNLAEMQEQKSERQAMRRARKADRMEARLRVDAGESLLQRA